MSAFRLIRVIVPLVALALGLPGGAGAGTVAAQTPHEEENVVFRWAFGAMVKAGGGTELVSITENTTLRSGDRLKMFLQVEKKCYVYLIYRDAAGALQLLFPYDLRQLGTDFRASTPYYIPRGSGWFELDAHTGRETFYLMASARRLDALETLIAGYASADAAKRPERADEILSEIRKIRWRHRQFKTFAERPAAIVGHVRGGAEAEKTPTAELADLAVEISAREFFSRTFTIEHR